MWWAIAVNLFVVVVAALLYKPPPPPPGQTVEDLQVPRSNEGDPIYDVVGTAWVEDAHVIWYGDFRREEIKAKDVDKK